VDDEPISRKAVVRALSKAHLKAISLSSPAVAMALLEENSFDLVFLDIDMPDMNGFELCSNLRKLPGHAKTPVVFVTGLSDFDSRANSMISGGTDLIGKPFLPIELAVKALRYILSSHVESHSQIAVGHQPAT
jgi:PleD family two-component response regulator